MRDDRIVEPVRRHRNAGTALRALVREMEMDLGTHLDWVAVDQWNVDNPQIHLLVLGRTDQGTDLVMARVYFGHCLRSRAQELAFADLGPKPAQEVQPALDRDVTAERWTRLSARRDNLAGVLDV